MPKSVNLNILGSHDTQVSEPGQSWPSCFDKIINKYVKYDDVLPHSANVWLTHHLMSSLLLSSLLRRPQFSVILVYGIVDAVVRGEGGGAEKYAQ